MNSYSVSTHCESAEEILKLLVCKPETNTTILIKTSQSLFLANIYINFEQETG